MKNRRLLIREHHSILRREDSITRFIHHAIVSIENGEATSTFIIRHGERVRISISKDLNPLAESVHAKFVNNKQKSPRAAIPGPRGRVCPKCHGTGRV